MIDVTLNTDAISAALAGLVGQLGNMRPVMAEIGDYLYESTKQRFNTGTGPDGTAWAPRSPVTLAIYARQKPPKTAGAKPLTVTGTMRAQIHRESGSDYAEVGSNAIQAAVMQFGAVKGSLGAYWYTTASGKTVEGFAPWGNIPARPFIGLSTEDEANVLDIISEALERAMQA